MSCRCRNRSSNNCSSRRNCRCRRCCERNSNCWDNQTGSNCTGTDTLDTAQECDRTTLTSRSPRVVLVVVPIIKDNNLAVAIGGGNAENEICCEEHRPYPQPGGAIQETEAFQNADNRTTEGIKLDQNDIKKYIKDLINKVESNEDNPNVDVIDMTTELIAKLMNYLEGSFK